MVLGLQLRLYLLVAAMFAILYGIITVVGTMFGVVNFSFFLILGLVMMLVQYLIGPSMVKRFMRVKEVSKAEEPELHAMIEDLAKRAKIPKPKVGISQMGIPNAFAYGRSRASSNVCVTQGLINLLSKDELRAVLGHEVSHIKNRDMAFITLLSVIPMVLFHLGWSLMWSRNREGGSNVLIGVGAFFLYFLTNLLVLYGSRIREYYADKGSVELGSDPHQLASALYKLTYGNAAVDKRALRQMEGYKAFFVSDPSRAVKELRSLKIIDKDMDGTVDHSELAAVRGQKLVLSTGEKLVELLSTHPNMLKRIKHLSGLGQ